MVDSRSGNALADGLPPARRITLGVGKRIIRAAANLTFEQFAIVAEAELPWGPDLEDSHDRVDG